MKKLVKRWIAGVSAATLLVSAVGFDAFTNVFMRTVSADSASSQKNAKSTGFNNLEQDTDSDDNYNTGYGLHTNKTASIAEGYDDGRTFDVNLESWYVGENPVDVATLLDASGSMAWTVDTLDPLEVSEQLDDADKAYLMDKYGTDNLATIQKDNGDYLPQDVVDLILDPKKTDNTKLSYAGYMYYVYEARSFISEFVPLGYWDGGVDPKTDPSLIGYYPFSGDLKNKAPDKVNDTSAAGMLINHPSDDTADYNLSAPAQKRPEAVFSEDTYEKKKNEFVKEDKGLDIRKTALTGGVLLDSPKSEKFTIKMKFSEGHLVTNDNRAQYGNTPFLYITDGENFYKFYRRGNTAVNRMGVDTPTKTQFLNINNVFNASDEQEWTFDFDFTTNKLKLTTDDTDIVWTGTTGGKEYSVDLTTKLDTSNLKVILGYADNPEEIEKFSDVYIKSVNITDNEEEIADYAFSVETKSLQNSINEENATFVTQGDYNTKIEILDLEPQFSSDNKSLDICKTGANGAVLLDAMPNSNDYTLSFKMKINKGSATLAQEQSIIYVGDGSKTEGKYQRIYRRNGSGGNHIGILNRNRLQLYQYLNSPSGDYNNTWATITVTVDGNDANVYVNGVQKYKVSDYTEPNLKWTTDNLDKLDLEQMKILLAGLWDADNYKDAGEIYLDDVYVFNKALDSEIVRLYFSSDSVPCNVGDDTTHALSYVKDAAGNYVKNEDGTLQTVEIAQISNGEKRLGKNTNIDQRRGWYYVNSASDWEDITGCLESGKEYIGIFTDDGLNNGFADMANDTASIPAGFEEGDPKEKEIAAEISAGDTDIAKYEAPKTERSIRFYVDTQNHLRCFAWSGADTTKEDDERTFCSIVYEKEKYEEKAEHDEMKNPVINRYGNATKYEELNYALNNFYQSLANYSDLSNTSVVRFSTINAIGKDKTATNDNLQKLIMEDWTNWSDYYRGEKAKDPSAVPDRANYLHDLLIPEEGETALGVNKSAEMSGEYPYVMTGGTYTWTGLKAFYDNMIANTDDETVSNVAGDARDKYLIIFTDGRDNTQDYEVSDLESTEEGKKLAGSPDYATGSIYKGDKYVNDYNPYKDDPYHKVGFSIQNYDDFKDPSGKTDEFYKEWQVQEFQTDDHTIQYDGDLAEAWADKIKEAGYTIYCVMLATGSISSTTNAGEYNKAKNFLKSLSGGEDVDKEIDEMQAEMDNYGSGTKPDEYAKVQRKIEALKDNYVLVVDPTTGTNTLESAFEQILEQIQQPRSDYTVQDYIDPRFNLIGRAYTYNTTTSGYNPPFDVIYHLGAGGKITFTDTNNKPIKSDNDRIYFDNAYGNKIYYPINGVTVNDIIDIPGAQGLAYTPRDSYMVNRTSSYNYEENKYYYDTGDGTGTGYLYYDDDKDMYYLRWENQVIPMEDEAFDTDGTGKKLDVWSATICLQAKGDFIGGNNILTNGNEAGENLVYSEATIENMDKHSDLYFADSETPHTLREKLQALSGTDRKINAVDAGGVSQAVYGKGIDIPSSGFPRTTVNVRLLELNAKDLNDVIYMGEVVSPTMMLADLENGYMEGSYYLEYLRRYAYRLYGYDAAKTPLLDLLNQWLKIDKANEFQKTFTIPYIYLPEPIYNNDNTLATVLSDGKNKVIVNNSTGMTTKEDGDYVIADFEDPNLRDVTGFITYTWKRDKGSVEEQQKVGTDKYDITQEYVVKDTNQIKYDLQLKFTPLQEGALPADFKFDDIFITDKGGTNADKFFGIVGNEFDTATEWSIGYNRADYLQAMVDEKHTYTPHVMYDASAGVEGKKGKWVLIDDTKDGLTTDDALNAYKGDDAQITIDKDNNTLTDKGVYDWDTSYKPVVGIEQIEGDKLTDYYTNTPDNVGFADKNGITITENGEFIDTKTKADVCSLVANTTYVKDVVNGALALELIVDGTYLKQADSPIKKDHTYTLTATRYYDDPIDPLPYNAGVTEMNADTGNKNEATGVDGKKYQLTFQITDLPKDPQEHTLYQVWAELEKVAVYNGTTYDDITSETTSGNKYIGYQEIDALPIGTYVIDTTDNPLSDPKFQMGKNELNTAEYFKYLKIDNAPESYTYDKFPASVYNASQTAPDSTGVDEYLIKNGGTDYSQKNIANCNRKKTGTAPAETQTVTFYFGTVDRTIKTGEEEKVQKNTKGYSHLVDEKNDYAKDRLGIILLSADPNSLAISKTVTNTEKVEDFNHLWTFTVTFEPDKDKENMDEFNGKNDPTEAGFTLNWYTFKDGKWESDTSTHSTTSSIHFEDTDGDGKYTAILYLKDSEKVVITGLPEGKWQVTETDERPGSSASDPILYSAHNNMDDKEDHEFSNATNDEIQLNPASHVDFINEFPYELPSTGDIGTDGYIFIGTMITIAAILFTAKLLYNRRKRRAMQE